MAAIFEINLGFVAGILIGIAIGVFIAWRRRKSGGYVGTIIITESDKGKVYSLELNRQPEALIDKKEVTFKIEPPKE